MFSPYELEIILHYNHNTTDHPDLQRNPPIWDSTIMKFIRLGLLQEGSTFNEAKYSLTTRGYAFVHDGLCKTPLPVHVWSMPRPNPSPGIVQFHPAPGQVCTCPVCCPEKWAMNRAVAEQTRTLSAEQAAIAAPIPSSNLHLGDNVEYTVTCERCARCGHQQQEHRPGVFSGAKLQCKHFDADGPCFCAGFISHE